MNKPTLSEVRADASLLRRVAGSVLNPGPWKHDGQAQAFGLFRCKRCKAVRFGDTRWTVAECIPDEATGSLADIAEALLRKVLEMTDDTILACGHIAISHVLERGPRYA